MHTPAPEPPVSWQGLLGYLNFSAGKPDAKFQGQLHAAYRLAGQRTDRADRQPNSPTCSTHNSTPCTRAADRRSAT